MDFDGLSLDQLEALQQSVNAERAALKAQALAIQQVIDARSTDATVDRFLSSLSPEDRVALAQRIRAEGVGSAEMVGTPGA